MEGASLSGLTQVPTRETFFRIIFMAQVSIDGPMEGFIRESGRIIKWKVKVYLRGAMAGDTWEAIKMIRSMAMVLLSGLTVGSILVNGFWGNSMVREFISKKAKKDKGFGRWVKELSGSKAE